MPRNPWDNVLYPDSAAMTSAVESLWHTLDSAPTPMPPLLPCFDSYWDEDLYYKKEKENDMFASRKEEDGAFRLCIRRGRVIKGTEIEGKPKSITFRTAKLAKDCADELNTKFFDQYDHYMDRDNNLRQPGVHVPESIRTGMVGVIMKYATLEDEVVGPTGN